MKIIYALFFYLSLNIFAGDLFFEILVDEFTDEETVALTITADDDHEIFRRWGQIVCNQGNLMFGIEDTEIYHDENYVNAKFRFNKNPVFESSLDFDIETSVAITYSEELIFKFLDELRSANSFIIKLEPSDTSMKFSDIDNSEKQVSEFLNALVYRSNC